MRTSKKWATRGTSLFAMTAAAAVAMTGLAAADNVINEIVTSSANDERIVNRGTPVDVKYYIDSNNAGGQDFEGCDAADGSAATINISAPAGVTVSDSTLEFTACGEENAQTATFSSNVVDRHVISVSVSDAHGNYGTGSASWQLVVRADDAPTNRAPVVSDPAEDKTGPEGSLLQASGAFTDPDGDPLTLTSNDPDHFTDNGDGTWSWSHTPADNFTNTNVTVEAMDEDGLTVSDDFDWNSTNVNPSVNATAVADSACTVKLDASFTDPGTADTHGVDIDWNDGSTPVTGAAHTFTNGVGTVPSLMHTYSANGTYNVSVTVTDDDLGVGQNAAGSASFATKNTAGNIMQPINYTGPRSSFKIGSTIPVKITVTGCDGLPVTNLTPKVDLFKLDGNAETQVNEVVSTSTPTSGVLMRWADTQYIYNLSTKNSQFSPGTTLGAGTYRVQISDPSFYASRSAEFDLRK